MLKFSTDQLLNKIKDGDMETRLMAIKYLGMRYDKRSIKPLIELLDDENNKVKEQAIYSLGAIGRVEDIVDSIIQCLKVKDKKVKLAAIKVLGETGSNKATKPLIRLLSAEDKKIRESVVVALGQIRDKNALFPLMDMLEEKDIGIKINTILSLGKLGDPRSIESIIKCLDDEPSVTKMAAITLNKFDDEKIIEPLVRVLDSNDPKIRQCAVYSLGNFNDSKVIDPMLNLLNDEDPYVRQATASALSNIKDDKIIQKFIEKLNDIDEEVRETAARALGKLKDKKARKPLESALNDKYANVREEALRSLGNLGIFESSKKILKSLKDEEINVRAAAAAALGDLFRNLGEDFNLKEKFHLFRITQKLKKKLKDKEPKVRINCGEALAKLNLSLSDYLEASKYYKIASKESFTWDFHQAFYEACSYGCEILDRISKNQYQDFSEQFKEINSSLYGSAKLFGIEEFLSKKLWNIVEKFVQIMRLENKSKLKKYFKDFGMNLLILTKKLPESLQYIIEKPQNDINETIQIIEKKGLSLEKSKSQLKSLKPVLFDLVSDILQLEPLKARTGEISLAPIDILESLSEKNTNISSASDMDSKTSKILNDMLETEEDMIDYAKENNFDLSEKEFAFEINLGKKIQVSLIQLHKGVRKLKLTEDKRSLWERNVKRYYDFNLFKYDQILKITHEAEIMRVKPKIIGFMDDAIYEGSTLVIFPELSIPETYLEKLQGYADRFDLFIIAGIEHIRKKNKNLNLAYLIGPNQKEMVFQQKNTPMIISGNDVKSEWHENIQKKKPPHLNIFKTGFGRFIILIGQDCYELNEYIPFISRENQLDLVIMIHNGILMSDFYKNLSDIAINIKKPILFVNTGLYGGTNVFLPDKNSKEKENILTKRFTDGIHNWEFEIPKWVKIQKDE